MIGLSIFGLLFIAGIGSLVLSIMTAVSASKYPDWAFQQSGTAKFVWQVLPILLLFACGYAGGVMGIIWYSGTRDRVEAAARAGGPAPYGYWPPPPQQYGYGAPPPGYGPPPAPGGWAPPGAPPGYSPPPPSQPPPSAPPPPSQPLGYPMPEPPPEQPPESPQ